MNLLSLQTVQNGTSHSPPADNKSDEEPKIEESESIKPIEKLENKDVAGESNEIKPRDVLEKNDKVEKSTQKVENHNATEDLDKIVSLEELENKSKDLDKIVSVEELENKSEIDAVLSELENSTEETLKEESESVPAPPPMPDADKTIIEEPKTPKMDLENGEPKETLEMETVELTKDQSEKESKDEADVTPNGSVKQLAIELGKKMTFKADIERVPEQNGIKNE